MPTPSQAIETYLRAKDENRPHLMVRAFVSDARLDMAVKTGAISFPPLSIGVTEITKVLVQDFGQANQNVYTFCLAGPPDDDSKTFSCDWLVGMSVKEDGAVRVGCGRYDWVFQNRDAGLVERLKITIETMQVLPPAALGPVMTWLSALPYPWCATDKAIGTMPAIAGLEPIAAFLNQNRSRNRGDALAG